MEFDELKKKRLFGKKVYLLSPCVSGIKISLYKLEKNGKDIKHVILKRGSERIIADLDRIRVMGQVVIDESVAILDKELVNSSQGCLDINTLNKELKKLNKKPKSKSEISTFSLSPLYSIAHA